MTDENSFLKEFSSYYSGNIEDYALVKDEVGYSILNVKEETTLLIDDVRMGNFFVEKLLDMGVPVYRSIKDIPGWGTKKRERPPDMHPQLKELIDKMRSKEKK